MSISHQSAGHGYGHMVSSLSFAQGWVMYANPDIQGPGRALVLHGNVSHFELSREMGRSYAQGLYSDTTEARFMMSGAVLLTGRPMDQMAGEAIQAYPGEGRRRPPQLAAMRELARRHPDEYASLCEQYGLPPLTVVRDAWAGG